MSHLDAETLSAYLDEEIAAAEASVIELHLRSCGDCRVRVEGLRRVISGLESIERAAPPRVLDQAVQRRIALEKAPRGLLERVEARLRRFQGLQPSVGLVFALVLALAIVVYLFSTAIQRQGGSAVIVPVESSDEIRSVGERELRRLDDRWLEIGLLDPPERLVHVDSSQARAVFDREPGLERLLRGQGAADALVIRFDGEVWEITTFEKGKGGKMVGVEAEGGEERPDKVGGSDAADEPPLQRE